MDAQPFRQSGGAMVYRISEASGLKPATCRLTDKSFAWDDGGAVVETPLSDILCVRIFKSPGMTLVPAYQRCTIVARGGGRWTIASDKFVGGAFGARIDEFRAFVCELVVRVQRANPGARFVSGLSPVVWGIAAAAFVLIELVFAGSTALTIAAGLENREWAVTTFVAVLLLAAFLVNAARMWPLVHGGRPRSFDPGAPGESEP